MNWILVLLTTSLTITSHPGNVDVSNSSGVAVAGHFTSKSDCLAFQDSIHKYHLLNEYNETVKGNKRVRVFTATVCVSDPK
jgi:hypothetical protein